MRAPLLLRCIWCAAGLALLLGLARDPLLGLMSKARELPRLDGATGQPWVSEGFVPGGAHQFLAPGTLPPGIPNVSSWVGGDAWRGRAETAWFRVTRSLVHVGVAGCPQQPGCRLWAEFRAADGAVTHIVCPLPSSRTEWSVWEIHRPPNAIVVRIVATDDNSESDGWIAFSHPFRAWPGIVTAAFLHLQLWTTVALAMTLIWGPGLLWAPRSTTPETRMALLLGAGPFTLVALGILIWCASGMIAPGKVAFILVAALWLALGVLVWRNERGMGILPMSWRRGASSTGETPVPRDDSLRRTLAVSALIVIAVVAKSTYSVGPEGELYRGLISRNLTVGDRIDARYPFHVVQAAARHLAPAAPETEKYFYPWTFFSRGPLAGLAPIPVVLATGGQPPADFPDQRWSPFDRYGFAAYRVTMIVLSSGIIVALFLLLVPLAGETWALTAAGLLALTPFGVHEVMFTWPKWPATIWLMVSFAFAHARRPLGAGVALGIGFLFHPMALLWTPWLALWSAARSTVGTSLRDVRDSRTESDSNAESETDASDRRPYRRTGFSILARTFVAFTAGAAVLVLPWMALGKFMPHLPDTPFAGQGNFLRYWQLADSKIPITGMEWWRARWLNFANTFLPAHLYFSGFDHFRMQSAYEPSPRLVKFAFVWWNSLPFGLGLGLWAASGLAMLRALRTLRAATWLFAIGPALLLVFYWGMDPLGLMRECGHPILVAIIAITCLIAARANADHWLPRVLRHRAVPWVQLPETWLMLWLTTLLNPRPWAVDYDHLDPLCLLINALALIAAASVVSRARAAVATSEPASPVPDAARA